MAVKNYEAYAFDILPFDTHTIHQIQSILPGLPDPFGQTGNLSDLLMNKKR